jgi:hypothetical protein
MSTGYLTVTCKVLRATKITGSSSMIGFISTLVTISLLITFKYSVIADLHTHTRWSSPRTTVKTQELLRVSLNHTLPIPLHYSTHKAFKTYLKSSQVDELSVAIFYRVLRTQNWIVVLFVFKITPLHGPQGKHSLPLLWMHAHRSVAWQQSSTRTPYKTVSLYCWGLSVFT